MPDQATRMRQIAAGRAGAGLPGTPKVVTVTSGKGGVGKSTIALNLAFAFVETGKSVLLVDADANLANLDIMLGVSPRFRLSNVLRGEVDLEDILISPQRGLRVLPGSSGEVDYPLLSADMQEEFFEGLLQMDERPDLILIDTAAGLSQEIVWYAARSSEVFVVTSAEPTSIMDAYAMIKVLTASDASIPVDLLLNSIRSPQEAEETVQKFRMAVKHFLKREIGYLGFVPFDQTVQKAVLQQQPVIRSFPRSAAAQAIRGIGRQWGAEQWSGSVRRAKAS